MRAEGVADHEKREREGEGDCERRQGGPERGQGERTWGQGKKVHGE